MPINTRGIRFGTSGVPAPPDILGSADNGCKGRRLLRIGVSGLQGRDAGGLAIPHHFQHGGGCGGETLGCSDGGERGRAERAQTIGHTPKCPLLRG